MRVARELLHGRGFAGLNSRVQAGSPCHKVFRARESRQPSIVHRDAHGVQAVARQFLAVATEKAVCLGILAPRPLPGETVRMLPWLVLLLHTFRFAFRTRADMVVEILALRHQVGVLQRSCSKRPRLHRFDRAMSAWLCGIWLGWRRPLVIVQPATVVRWFRNRWLGHRRHGAWQNRAHPGCRGDPACAR